MFKNMKFTTKLYSSYGLILSLMLAVTVVVLFSVKSLVSNFGWVDHTHKVLAKASSIEAAAVDMETGMRGYLLAGKADFLAPYKNGEQTFNTLTGSLADTVSDNPAQVALIKDIKSTINEWQKNVTEPVIALRTKIGNAKNMDDMADLIGQAQGKQYFDKFRAQLQTFIEREQKLMIERKEYAQNSTSIEELRALSQRVEHTYRVIATAQAIIAAAVDMETGMRGFLLAGKEEFLSPYINGKEQFSSLTSQLSNTVSDNPAQVMLLGSAKSTIDNWISSVVEKQIALRRSIGDAKTMNDMADLVGEAKGKVYFDKFREQIKTFKQRETSLMNARMVELEETESAVINTTILGTILAIISGIVIAVWLTRHIMNLLGGEPVYIAEIARTVAKGDLSIELKSDGNDRGIFAEMKNMIANLKEKAELAQTIAAGELDNKVILASDKDSVGLALQEMTTNLNEVLGQTKLTSIEISQGSYHVSETSAALSEGASAQAVSLENISASLNQLSTQIGDNAQSANQAQELATLAQSSAEQGIQKMETMIAAMAEISLASESIADFINTIDDIADQTNLLALNAAIEAARAGEQGRGFAVVADEVRQLAARSTTAAEETSKLIASSVEKTKNGSLIATQTAESLKSIFESVSQTNVLVEQIALASNEQAIGAEEINKGVSEVDSVTKQNNSTAQESAAAAEQLSQQAELLKSMLSRFKLNETYA
ncbi:MAG: CHASE3 domain-containing protein [Moritella sp.]|uniref:CHASE3 domain-containing protein n=1 Tax=Moritella sp. TaxID=78556 RepID=UPI00216F461A|nr:CHASE3 domain-containing protein [Moritella sp.]MBL1418105.1 CHASE3 domain-containing protein [Moritella sp.]